MYIQYWTYQFQPVICALSTCLYIYLYLFIYIYLHTQISVHNASRCNGFCWQCQPVPCDLLKPLISKGASPSAVSAMRPLGEESHDSVTKLDLQQGRKNSVNLQHTWHAHSARIFATTLKVHGCRLFKNALYVEGSCFHKKAYVKTIKDGLPFSHQIH